MGYESSEDLEQLAKDIIEEHHPHLRRTKICYLFKDSAGETKIRTGKRLKVAHAEKVSDKMQAADCPFTFVIVVNEKIWHKLNPSQKIAVMDHELEHCKVDDDGWFIRDHDLEEFVAIVKRRGMYFEAIRAFVEVARDLGPRLPFDLPADDQAPLPFDTVDSAIKTMVSATVTGVASIEEGQVVSLNGVEGYFVGPKWLPLVEDGVIECAMECGGRLNKTDDPLSPAWKCSKCRMVHEASTVYAIIKLAKEKANV